MRRTALVAIADFVAAVDRPHPVRVAIDGRTASGKTTIADELAHELNRIGRATIRTSIDGFHRLKRDRYARGRHRLRVIISTPGILTPFGGCSWTRWVLAEP